MRTPLLISGLIACAIRLLFKKPFHVAVSWTVFPLFFDQTQGIGSYVEVFDLFRVQFSARWEIRILFCSSTCKYPAFLAMFVENTVFSRCILLASLSNSSSCRTGLNLVPWSYPIDQYACLMPVLFDYLYSITWNQGWWYIQHYF